MINVTVGNNLKRTSVIVSENSTLRSVLENAEIDYTKGSMHLDGVPLQPGDLDKTFADFGIAEKCYLLNVVKADNAASVAVVGDAVVITSDLKLEDIKTLEKYRPKALKLMGGENNKEEIFGICTSTNGCLSKYGAEFAGAARNESGKATITYVMDGDVEDVKAEVADKFGLALTNLAKLEKTLPAVIEEVAAERKAIIDSISVQ